MEQRCWVIQLDQEVAQRAARPEQREVAAIPDRRRRGDERPGRRPGEAAADLAAAYEGHGFAVAILRETPDLVQMEVTGAQGQACKVDLGVFWRSRSPVLLEVGPVLHPDDAAGGKMEALFNPWAPRDFLDVDAILSSGRYTRQPLLAIAAEHNPGFSQEMFAEPLSYLRDIPTGNSPPTARIVSRSPGCARTSRTGSTNLKAPPDQQGTQARRAPPTLATSLAA